MKVRSGFVSNSSSSSFIVPLEVFHTPDGYKKIIALAEEFVDHGNLMIVGENIIVPFLGDFLEDSDCFKERICKVLCLPVESYWANKIEFTNVEL